MKSKLSIIIISLLFFSNISIAQEIPLNKYQLDLISKINGCENYSECEFNNSKLLIDTLKKDNSNYVGILDFFVDRLILIGELEDWLNYQNKIEEFVYNQDIDPEDRIWTSTNYAWKLYTIKELRNYEKAIDLLQFVINQKNGDITDRALAHNLMGSIYFGGYAINRDINKAVELTFKAAELGDYYSYSKIAAFYTLGLKSIKPNFNKAVRYYKLKNLSWFEGSNDYMLEILYKYGRLPKDVKELEIWLLEFNKKNYTPDIFLDLALFYEYKEEYEEAYKWHLVNIELNEGNKYTSIYASQKIAEYKLNEVKISEINVKKTKLINNIKL